MKLAGHFNFVVMKNPVLICGHQEGEFCYPQRLGEEGDCQKWRTTA